MASELRYMLGFLKEDIEAVQWTASNRYQQPDVAAAEAGTTVRY